MSDFIPAVSLVLIHEGGLGQDVHYDSGLCTKFGISLIFYRKNIKYNAIDQDIKDLTIGNAVDIYKEYFWDKWPFAQIDNQKLCNRLFDLSVNCGPKQAFLLIQRAANDIGAKLDVDGILGVKSIAAINSPNIQDSLYKNFIQEATEFYEKIANIAHNKRFLRGWLNRLNDTP
jgi:lysozyme family protein